MLLVGIFLRMTIFQVIRWMDAFSVKTVDGMTLNCGNKYIDRKPFSLRIVL